MKAGQLATIKCEEHGCHTYRVTRCTDFKCKTCDLRKKRMFILDLTYIEETPLVCGWDANECFERCGFDKNFKKI